MQTDLGLPRGEIAAQLSSLKNKGLFRRRLATNSPQAKHVILDGKKVLNFCSNDFLGLANDPRIVKSFQQAAEKYGVGSGASPLVCGRSTAHTELEEHAASITGRDRALVFSSGYLANLAIVGTLATGRHDIVFQDKLNHASMIDAALLSPAKLIRYPHGDVDALKRSMLQKQPRRKLVLTDAVFSMDGTLAPIAALATLSAEQQACLIIDDAHGFGVFGNTGGGVLESLGLGQSQVPVMMATFGKAVGSAGAFVAGTEDMIELLIQKARPYIYSTALAPALAAAASRGLRLLETEAWRREHLFVLIERFRKGARQAGLPLQDSPSPIQPLMVGAADKAVAISDALLDAGILITAIRPPTVPMNSSRLRITFSANHTEQDIDMLLDALVTCCPGKMEEAAERV